MSERTRVLFVSLVNDVGCDRIVSAMGRLDCVCAVIGLTDGFAARSRFVDLLIPMPARGGVWAASLLLAGKLRRAVRDWHPDLVVPLDDLSTRLLHDGSLRRALGEAGRALLDRSLGTCHDIVHRAHAVEVAERIGLRTPRQRVVRSLCEAEFAAWEFGYPVVLKRDGTCGGFGVAIVSDADELAAAFRRARRIANAKRALQRLIGLAVDGRGDLVLQSHVGGAMAYRVAACAQGRVLDAISFQPSRIDPPVTGASTMLVPVSSAEMDTATEQLVAALGCSGVVSLDFILSSDGEAHLIELNARPVATGHLGRLYGHDLYAALVASLRSGAVAPCDAVAGPEQLALFPRELARDPAGADLDHADVHHDVPWDEPALLDAYAEWLTRRHPGQADAIHRRLGSGTLAQTPRRRFAKRGMDPASSFAGGPC